MHQLPQDGTWHWNFLVLQEDWWRQRRKQCSVLGKAIWRHPCCCCHVIHSEIQGSKCGRGSRHQRGADGQAISDLPLSEDILPIADLLNPVRDTSRPRKKRSSKAKKKTFSKKTGEILKLVPKYHLPIRSLILHLASPLGNFCVEIPSEPRRICLVFCNSHSPVALITSLRNITTAETPFHAFY